MVQRRKAIFVKANISIYLIDKIMFFSRHNNGWTLFIYLFIYLLGWVIFIFYLPPSEKDYKNWVEKWYKGGSFFKGRMIVFLINFFKVIIFIFILPLELCNMFEHIFFSSFIIPQEKVIWRTRFFISKAFFQLSLKVV